MDIEEYNHYLNLASTQYKNVDINLLEYSVASYLIYDKNGIERPETNSKEFILRNEIIEKLIENTKNINIT